MMQSADFWKGDDLTFGHYRSPRWSVFGQAQVSAGAIIVGKVALQQTAKMPPIQNHHMIEAFAANRADEPFSEFLPGERNTIKNRSPGEGDLTSMKALCCSDGL
jgi:hypothetical protein